MDSKINTLADVERLIADQVKETHALEFKRKTSPDDIDLGREDRKLFGEALSGFANATGGVLIIGVGTEKDHGIDRASKLYPLNGVESVAARYRSYANECVSPPIEGLAVRALSDSTGAGVVVIDVPKGQARPHMSTAPGHHTYYRRVMDSFVPMQHYEVEEMIRLKTQPNLSFVHKLVQSGSIGKNRNYHILFGLSNSSK